MVKRSFLLGVLGGLVSSIAAYYPLYRWLPAQFVAGWPQANERTAAVRLALMVLLWLLTGALAARQGGGTRWQAAGAGALAGLLAAWVTEALLGGAAAGVWGARLLLAHGLEPTQDKTTFVFLLTHSVASILWGSNLSVWLVGGLGALLGALGGSLANASKPPVAEDPSLWLLVCALVTPVAAFALVVTVATIGTLSSAMEQTTLRYGFSPPYPVESVFTLPVASHLVWLFFWQIMSWRLTRQATPTPTLRLPLMVLLSLLLLLFFSFVSPTAHLMEQATLGSGLFTLLVTPWGLAVLGALAYWAAPRIRRPWATPPGPWKRLTLVVAALRRQGEARLAAWYFFAIHLLTWLAVLNIDRATAHRHPWLHLGLTAGVVLGALGIWETSRAPAGEAEGPNRLPWFTLGALSGYLNSLWTFLGNLGMLAIIMLTIPMIAPLTPPQGSEAPTTAPFTLTELVQQSFRLPALLFLSLLGLALAYALFFGAVMTVALNEASTPPQEEPSKA